MNEYDRGYGRGRGPDRSDWYGGGPRGSGFGNRPWMGGYEGGYQGGGSRTSGGGMGRYASDYAPRYGRGYGAGRPAPRQGGDYWWLGERAYQQPASYDEAYRAFDEQHHPRYSPVGGMYPAMGGEYQYGRAPRPLREDTWFSDWTRWF